MNPRNLTRAELVNFLINAATAVAAGKVPGLSPAQAVSFESALLDAAAGLSGANTNQVAGLAASMNLTQIAQDERFDSLSLLQQFKYAVKGTGARASEFDAVGFDPPAEGRTIIKPQAPTQLSAAGYSNGVNVLKFTGNNVPGTVTYVVEARISDDPEYRIVGTSTKQLFRHFGVIPGRFYQYRVHAQAARSQISASSNEAVVYAK